MEDLILGAQPSTARVSYMTECKSFLFKWLLKYFGVTTKTVAQLYSPKYQLLHDNFRLGYTEHIPEHD